MRRCSVTPCEVNNESFIFISYAHADADVVFPIMEALEARGYVMWYDHGITISSTWTNVIGNAIIGCHVFVVFVTAQSAASVYVLDEVGMAKSKGKTIIPIYLEGMGVLTTGLELGLNSTQGINESDPNVILERLCDAFAANGVMTSGDSLGRLARKARLKAYKPKKDKKKKGRGVARAISSVIIALTIAICAILITTFTMVGKLQEQDPEGEKTSSFIENIKNAVEDALKDAAEINGNIGGEK